MIPSYIILHHSLTKDSGTVSWQAIRRYHTETKGWNDIGYHFGIELVDDIYEILSGRLMGESGAHCTQQGMNHKSIGICVVGNFDKYPVPEEAWGLTRALCNSLCHMLKIPVENIKGHREYASYKTCPGLNWDMDKFRNELKETLT